MQILSVAPTNPPIMSPDPISSGSIVWTIIVLVGVLAAAYFTTKFLSTRLLKSGLKQKNTSKSGKTMLGKYVNIVDRAPIDREKSVIVVEFEDKLYLVGVTPQEIRLIDKSEISEDELEDRRIRAEEEAERAKNQPNLTFTEALKQQWMQFFGMKKKEKTGQPIPKEDFESKLKKEMQSEQEKNDTDDKKDL